MQQDSALLMLEGGSSLAISLFITEPMRWPMIHGMQHRDCNADPHVLTTMSEHAVQATEVQHLTRLQTLRIDTRGSEARRALVVRLEGLPATVQRLVIDGCSRDIRICSWPSARPPADIELRSEGSLALDDASGQPPGRGQLPGCRVELHVRQLTIVDRCGTEQAESDTVSGLLHWTASSQAAIVVLDSDEDTFSLFDGDDGCLTVNIERDGRVVSTHPYMEKDADSNVSDLRRALQ